MWSSACLTQQGGSNWAGEREATETKTPGKERMREEERTIIRNHRVFGIELSEFTLPAVVDGRERESRGGKSGGLPVTQSVAQCFLPAFTEDRWVIFCVF